MRALHLSRSFVRSVLAVALAGLVIWPAGATAQTQPSLAELARKEAERRKTVKDSKKVITAKDLPESARKTATPPAAPAHGTGAPATEPGTATPATEHGAGAPAGGDQKPAGNAAQGDEAAWRGRIMQARETLQRNEVFLQALQTRQNALYNDFRNGAGTYTQQAQVNEDRQKNQQELERVKVDVENSRKLVANIEEEARKAGVPPGWLR
jgi:hypothetical protein